MGPSGVPCIRPPKPPVPERPRLPVMTVNGTGPDAKGNVVVDPPDLTELEGRIDGLADAVSEENRRAVGAEEELGGRIAAETSRAQTAEQGLRGEVSSARSAIADIEAKVPAQASAQNQLADKAFVNSSIATNTAFYISDGGRPFQSLADLENYEGALTNNDYAFVVGRDAAGNTTYTRYKWNEATETWAEEYVLNNSSFTAAQWEAISSGVTSGLVAKLGALPAAAELSRALADKVSISGGTMTGNLNINNTRPRLLLTDGTHDFGLKIVDGNKYIETEDYDYQLPDGDGTLALVAPNPTADHLAALDANGNLVDSGIAKTDVTARSVTWSELKSLRDSRGLVPGQLYRITDYVAATNGDMSSQSANHPFDVIVTADSPDRVNERARAAQHAGDQYFSGRGLHAWDVWYCLDNDANRFAWASASGKGVVYRLVDEWGNDLPYDFKGLKFKRDGVAFYTFDAGYRNGARVDVDRSLNGSDGYVTGNVMKPYTVEDNSKYMVVRHLNNNVCFGYAVEKNSWDEDCHGNTLGDRNISTANCSFNVFGKECRDNSFGPLFLNNTLGAVVHDCTYVYTGSNPAQDAANPAAWCQANTIGPYCAGISMVLACSGNVFAYGCLDITLAQNCKQNSFGAGCSGLSLRTSCLRNTFTHGYRSESPDPVIVVPEGTNRKVFTTADDAAATPGALKKVAVTGAYSDLTGTPSLDAAVTPASANAVGSSGIWSAIWGALVSLPAGFTSLYDWCLAQIAGKADSADLSYRIVEVTAPRLPTGVTYGSSADSPLDYTITFDSAQTKWILRSSSVQGVDLCSWDVDGTNGSNTDSAIHDFYDTDGEMIRVPALDVSYPLANRTVNVVTLPAGLSEATLKFPTRLTGYSRDFLVRLVIEGSGVPQISFVEPDGTAVAFDEDDEAWADIGQGVNILIFTDTAEPGGQS